MMDKRLKSEIAQRELGNLGCGVCASVEQVGSHTTVAYCLNKSLYLLFNTPVLAANLRNRISFAHSAHQYLSTILSDKLGPNRL